MSGSATDKCGVICSIDCLSRFSNPFITLVTQISAMIPSVIPAIEKNEIKEIKPLPLANFA